MENNASMACATAPQDGGGEEYQRQRPLHGRVSGPTRRSTKGQWTAEEDDILCRAVQRFKGKNWKKIGSSPVPLILIHPIPNVRQPI